MHHATQPARFSLGLFAKYPEQGRVKTRLIPLLGELGSAQFAHYLIMQSLSKLAGMAGPLCQLTLWHDSGTPAQWHGLFDHARLAPVVPAITLIEQPSGHLGLRMQKAIEHQLTQSDVAMLIGADAVGFQASHARGLLEATLANRHGIAFQAALDGGYVAVSMSQLHPEVFDERIAWGTQAVASQSRTLLAQSNKQATWLEALADVDEPEDYHQALERGLIPQHWRDVYGSKTWQG